METSDTDEAGQGGAGSVTTLNDSRAVSPHPRGRTKVGGISSTCNAHVDGLQQERFGRLNWSKMGE